ncbi:DUF4349 domain-containing protein [Oceanobacillus halophilus]|uniref:DUF4349 domain-containing protein n=1 Tax=Oceanobacillus halophilus TaxID=930130 RepID=A0A495A7B4_9BACI|nr:DUF4349 domain-containing protein [Oceanobacillus halophilus]RKQ35690.1 DUF4349 domain-containing protein [Oceanobacillus halophilus]
MKKYWILWIFCIFVLLTACSSNEDNMESSDSAAIEDSVSVEENSLAGDGASEAHDASVTENQEKSNSKEVSASDRKVIYTANIDAEVKNLESALQSIQTKAAEYDGYIVESSISGETEDRTANGHITARIPQSHFQEFMLFVEDGSTNVLESSTTGQDVTEEYIDLESRLKSKVIVEERLLSFMEQAEETEDLLNISNDLAQLQEEIEEITGRMNYLENKADLATVTIYLQENDVTLAGMSESDLNTWEKTKQQFLKSVNFLINVLSGLFVFLVGNLPIFILLGTIGIIIYFILRKSRKKE